MRNSQWNQICGRRCWRGRSSQGCWVNVRIQVSPFSLHQVRPLLYRGELVFSIKTITFLRILSWLRRILCTRSYQLKDEKFVVGMKSIVKYSAEWECQLIFNHSTACLSFIHRKQSSKNSWEWTANVTATILIFWDKIHIKDSVQLYKQRFMNVIPDYFEVALLNIDTNVSQKINAKDY